ncbi:MFS transporter [Paenalkalicoccus suaedae]|uniref:MFS transporter n=1 Tax=Paenalkalicoccus suaedae TaxID=2592382 RepID=A0A859FCL5_9BACI|nr:MFS transporter [Paenalkalicoccus suaedae]QKS69956.1 MFS transporter [Paenalkalicoccus suaedae]
MNQLFKDRKLPIILLSNICASIGSGMIMIAIPFMFLQKEGGAVSFGYMTIAVTIGLFITTPLVGSLIDKHSRKRILLVSMTGACIITAFFALGGGNAGGGSTAVWQLSVLFIVASFYYHLFYPTMFALNQELFEPEQYKTVNGLMEIQGQTAAVLAGVLAAILMPILPFTYLLSINAIAYLLSIGILLFLPYTHSLKQRPPGPNGVSLRFRNEGLEFLKQRPILFVFLLCSFMPFIGVMVTNYLFPIYIDDILALGAAAHGIKSFTYGIGAVLAGILLPICLRKWEHHSLIMILTWMYTGVVCMFVFVIHPIVFFVGIVFYAIGNAGIRVARNSFMMHHVPNDRIGRVDSVFRTCGLAIRIMLLTFFTQLVAGEQVLVSFYLLVALLVVSSGTITFIYGKLQTKRTTPFIALKKA